MARQAGTGIVELVLAPLAEVVADSLPPTGAERRHAAGLPAERALSFIAGRRLLRRLAARVLAQPAEQIEIAIAAGRGPSLATPPGWHLSLAHAGGWLLVGMGRQALGVDLEPLRPLEDPHRLTRDLGLSPVWPPPGQRASMANRHLLQCWTRAEAIGKALGEGVVDAQRLSQGWHEIVPKTLWYVADGRRGTLKDLRLGRGLIGSLAVLGPIDRVRRRLWSSLLPLGEAGQA